MAEKHGRDGVRTMKQVCRGAGGAPYKHGADVASMATRPMFTLPPYRIFDGAVAGDGKARLVPLSKQTRVRGLVEGERENVRFAVLRPPILLLLS